MTARMKLPRGIARSARWTALASVALLTVGCAHEKAHVSVPEAPPVPLTYTLVHCHDGTGHIAGSVPWILGGTCCCTPTREMFEVHRAEKTVPEDMTYEAYMALYAGKGIQVGPAHSGCNNRCEFGPHVVFGGKCMAAPTPGTANYEEVSIGHRIPAH